MIKEHQTIQLVQKIKAGDNSAANQLLEAYKGRIHDFVFKEFGQAASKLGISNLELIQEAYIHFLDAVKDFDPELGKAKFYTFAVQKMKWRLLDLFKLINRRNSKQSLFSEMKTTISMSTHNEDNSDYERFEDMLVATDNIEDTQSTLLKIINTELVRMKSRDREVCLYLLNNQTISKINSEQLFKISPNRASKIYKHFKNRITQSLAL